MKPEKYVERFYQKNLRGNNSGFPIATIAYYGPDDTTATKVAVGIVDENEEVIDLKRWFKKDIDVRVDMVINKEILEYIKKHKAQRSVTSGRIIGCPHEEGVDYPEDSYCPKCPYWMTVDRWTGEPFTDESMN